jgi:hypothetical protein
MMGEDLPEFLSSDITTTESGRTFSVGIEVSALKGVVRVQ